MNESIDSREYDYHLPDERIARYPLAERDASRLLVCRVSGGTIEHHRFADIPDHIPDRSMIVRNTTRVVRARIVTSTPAGERIEIMLLEPRTPSNDPAIALNVCGTVEWLAMVGGLAKLRRAGEIVVGFQVGQHAAELNVSIAKELPEGVLLRLNWTPAGTPFCDVLDLLGSVPLPPYLGRESTHADESDYQTVYAQNDGAVAAPTAGLHFTERLIEQLQNCGAVIADVSLHVGAGTFRPIRGKVSEHVMHRELVHVPITTIDALALRARSASGGFVMVGTTSLRTVESIYWYGVRLLLDETIVEDLLVDQWDPYRIAASCGWMPASLPDAFNAVSSNLRSLGLDTLVGRTGIMIVPGYKFAACDALVTNFHQPESTLILLVAAFLGDTLWRSVYNEALAEGYRFLSYGDGSLLIR